jgi:hypothetical protein
MTLGIGVDKTWVFQKTKPLLKGITHFLKSIIAPADKW